MTPDPADPDGPGPPVVPFVATPVRVVPPEPSSPVSFQVEGGDGPSPILLTITKSGVLEFGPGLSQDQASRAAAQLLARHYGEAVTERIAHLVMMLQRIHGLSAPYGTTPRRERMMQIHNLAALTLRVLP